ncbi:MAG: DHH family phosphoesterase, partial [Candidatus Gracilibacteria bacterium]|nr:DHH family phosphoesterase [Candidatus Gracilibacteria bacterium]
NTPIINIDHHASNPLFGTYNLVDTEASSTCELVFNLLQKMDARIDKQIATLILFGIIRDTNCFRNSIRPETFAVTGELVALGADYDQVIFETYRREKLNYLGLYGHILSNLISLQGGRIIGGVVTQALFKQYGILESEFGPQFINETLAAIDGTDFVFLIKEAESGENKLGLRARTDECNVSKIAQQFGGGGHIRASGATTMLSVEEIIKILEGI